MLAGRSRRDAIQRSIADAVGRCMFRRDESSTELLDLPEIDLALLRANLRDIRIVNRIGGGTEVVLQHLPTLLERIPCGQTVTLLDLATGSGDIPRAVVKRMQRDGRRVVLTLVDVSPQILAEARVLLSGTPDVSFALGDARATSFADHAFDVVLCSLALHHFSPPDVVRVLREMERLCRVGFIVNDIRRCRSGLVAAYVSSRVASRNALTRHDMPLSVRRAYTPAELSALLDAAGIREARVTTHPLFRMAAVRLKDVA